MKPMIMAGVLAATLTLSGCAGVQTVPRDCEGSWIYQSGILPGGPAAVRVAVATWLAVYPQHRPKVRSAAITAWQLLSTHTLADALDPLTAVLKSDPLVTNTALAILGQLDIGQVLDPCTLNVVRSLVKNIAIDAGALESDFR